MWRRKYASRHPYKNVILFVRGIYYVVGLTGRASALINPRSLWWLLLLSIYRRGAVVSVPARGRRRGPGRASTVQRLWELWVSLEPSPPGGHVDVHLLGSGDLTRLAEDLPLSAQLRLPSDHGVEEADLGQKNIIN